MLVAISSMQNFLSTLEDKAFKDSLCGCYNRHFLEIKQAEFAVSNDALQELLPISFIMCDIDGLKMVNDTYGHDKGNEYIILCHQILNSSVHEDKFIIRLGGDEFLVILTNTEQQVAQERVAAIEEKTKLFPDSQEKREILGMLKATGVALLSIANDAVKEKTGLDFPLIPIAAELKNCSYAKEKIRNFARLEEICSTCICHDGCACNKLCKAKVIITIV